MSKKVKISLLAAGIFIIVLSCILFLVLKNSKEVDEVSSYTVTFNSNGGTIIDKQVVNAGDKAKRPIDPIKEGYNFINWEYNNKVYSFNEAVNSDIVLYALWEKEEEIFEITFNSDGGTKIESQEVIKGGVVNIPTAPIKKGYIFDCWQLAGNEYDFDSKVEEDIELVAKWSKEKYLVSFDSKGGSKVNSQTIERDNKVSKPKDPTKEGYIFKGWKLNGKDYSFNNKVNKNITLVAEWDLKNASEYLISKKQMINENGYRYEGKDPNNYVTFNNELWRIIGVFDTINAETNKTESLVKIIRNDSIGEMVWDTEGDSGLNDWSKSDLQIILNGIYYNGEDTGYIYKNQDSNYVSVSVAKKGLNQVSRNLIQKVKWNLGSSSGGTASSFYKAERGTKVYRGRPISWNGNVGLMYPSDYGYAVDSNSCLRSTNLFNYVNNLCSRNNWLFSWDFQWTLTSFVYSVDSYDTQVFYVAENGGIIDDPAAAMAKNNSNVRPVVYLKSSVKILDNGKDGSQDKPYDLALN